MSEWRWRILRRRPAREPSFLTAQLSLSPMHWAALSIVKSYCASELRSGIRHFQSIGGDWVSVEAIDRLSGIIRTVERIEHALYLEFQKPGATDIEKCLKYAAHVSIPRERATEIWMKARGVDA